MLVSVLKVNNTDFGPRFRSCPAEHYNMLYSSPIFKHLCCIVLGSLGCCPFQGGGSVVVVDLLFIVLPIVCGSSLFVFVCYALLCVHSSFAIILKRKRELVALLLLSYRCLVIVNVLWLFLKMPLVGLQCVIVVFPYHTHLLFMVDLGAEWITVDSDQLASEKRADLDLCCFQNRAYLGSAG